MTASHIEIERRNATKWYEQVNIMPRARPLLLAFLVILVAQPITKSETSLRAAEHAPSVTTIGQVVTTGQELMNVVPDGSTLEIEAYLLNQDIGFVREGQEAVIKIDSFPYTRYGSIAGKVTHVATDAIAGNQAQQNQLDPSKPASGSLKVTSAAQRTEDLVFPILVAPAATTIDVDGKTVTLSAGMTVSVEVKTETRRAIDYLLSPLIEIQSTAMRER